MEWHELLSAAIAGGAITALATLTWNWASERRREKDAAQYLAIQIAFLLEGYALRCAEGVIKHELSDDSGGQAGRAIGKIPDPPKFPESDAYKFLDRGLINDVFEFPQLQQMYAEEAWTLYDVGASDTEEYMDAIKKRTITMGVRALEVAQIVRRQYGLPNRELGLGNWSIREYLQSRAKVIEDDQARARARIADRRPEV